MTRMMTNTDGRRFEYQLMAIAAGFVGFAVLAVTLFRSALADSPPAIPVGPILTVVARGCWGLGLLVLAGTWVHHRWFFSGRQRLRRALRGPEGYVDEHDLREYCGEAAALREAERFWRRPGAGLPVEQAGWEIGELISGRWTVRSQVMRAAYPRSAVVVAPQGAGKSQYIIPRILDAPGPAIVTSTKRELFDATGGWRQATCGEVYVFDPLERTGGANNMPFDPVHGAARIDRWGRPDPGYADAIAEAMVRGADAAKQLNETLWTDAGREILRCYLVAADLAEGGSQLVQAWAHRPDSDEPINILLSHPGRVPEGWLSLLRERLADPPKQRAGYFSTLVSCTDYLAQPGAAEACRAARHAKFNIADFVDQRCSLYIIGDKSRRGMAAMMTALTESLIYLAREYAKTRPNEKLPETLGMFLDEVANITPIDLPTWSSEARSYGIFVMPVIQSPAQLDEIWGADKRRIILENLITKIVLRDVNDERFLETLSLLGGTRPIQRTTEHTRDGSQGSVGLERVIPPDVIHSLPPSHAYVLGGAPHPAVVAFEPGYRRLERMRSGGARRPAWPRWWRSPIRAVISALELGRRR